MTLKAKLQILLKADDVEVAHSEDSDLWQQVLVAITGSRPLSESARVPAPGGAESNSAGGAGPLERMAQALGVEATIIQGAIAPTLDPPFLVLDAHRYEAMRKALPERGSNALSNIQMAGTLLGLWCHYANLGNATQAQAQAILDPLGKRDPNPGRGIKNAFWLQARAGGQFAINPAEISRSVAIAKCFCTKDWSSYLNTK